MVRLATCLVLAFALPAAAARRPAPAHTLEYELRLGSLSLGRVKYTVRPPRGAAGLREVRVQARIQTLGTGAFEVRLASSSWVDGRGRPVRARWEVDRFGHRSRVVARYDGTRVDGRYVADGEDDKRIRRDVGGPPQDLVTAILWLAEQASAAGATLKAPVYTGTFVYDVTAAVRAPERLSAGGRTRQALRVEVTAVRPGKTRELTVWVDPATRTPCKVAFEAPWVGEVEAVLVRERR